MARKFSELRNKMHRAARRRAKAKAGTMPDAVWNGQAGTNKGWHVPNNWVDQVVPNAQTNVIIPSGFPGGPLIDVVEADCLGLFIETGSTVLLQGESLDIFGPAVINGSLFIQGNRQVRSLAFAVGSTGVVDAAGPHHSMSGTAEFSLAGTYIFRFMSNLQYPILHMVGGTLVFDGGQLTNVPLVDSQLAPTPLLGDANFDGVVDGADLIAVQTNFGNVQE